MNWDEDFIRINEKISACKRCDHLCAAGKIYPTFGNFPHELKNVKLLIIGQAPGKPLKEEQVWKEKSLDMIAIDELYKAAMKKSRFGKWTNDLLARCDIGWEEVAFTNVIKCMPPEHKINDEMKNNCLPYLKDQMRYMSPKVFLSFGKFATEIVAEKRLEKSMEQLHASLVQSNGKNIISSYHPGFLFRKSKQEAENLTNELASALLEHLK